MNKKIQGNVIVIFAVLIAVLVSYLVWKERSCEIPIELVATQSGLSDIEIIKRLENKFHFWFMITGEEQHQNIISNGIPLPKTNLSENFLILSRFRIKSITYQPSVVDECCGLPVGKAQIDAKNSDPSLIYIYRMPVIWLKQATG